MFQFSIGDTVEVNSGVWEGSTGIVRQIDHQNRMVTINVDMFGRETPVEMSFSDVEIVLRKPLLLYKKCASTKLSCIRTRNKENK